MRVYCTDTRDLEHVLNFVFPDGWVGDMAAFLNGELSSLSIQALENVVDLQVNPE